MRFAETSIPGAYVLTQERHADERGFFARVWCHEELDAHGLDAGLRQVSVSHNKKRGTLRGLHVQGAPGLENKLVACTRGRLFDVILDLRPASPTHLRWFGAELSQENGVMMYIPEGVAHGYVTLADDTDVLYHISADHRPDLARGVRWNDPAFGIAWPVQPSVISDRDSSYPSFDPQSP